MKRSYFIVTAGLFLGFGASGCATYQVHPDFKERQKSIKTLACLPPDVAVYKLGFTGGKEPMYDLYPAVKTQTVEELQRVFEEKGYEIRPLDLSESALNQEPELRTTLHTVQEVYQKTLGDIAKRRQKKFTYSIGSEINSLADWAQADVLLMVKWEAYKKTGGEIAKDMAKTILIAAATFGSVVPIFPTSQGLMQVAVVDGNTGDILWYHNNLATTAVDVEQEEQLKRAVAQAVKPFPLSAAKQEEEKAKRRKSKPGAFPKGIQPAMPPAPPGR